MTAEKKGKLYLYHTRVTEGEFLRWSWNKFTSPLCGMQHAGVPESAAEILTPYSYLRLVVGHKFCISYSSNSTRNVNLR